MFKRRADQPEKETVQIGQPQLLHTTYSDQDIIPRWQGLSASAAPSEYFQRPIKQSPSRLSKHRATEERELSANLNQALAVRGSESPEMDQSSSIPHLPNPLGYHQKPLPARPEDELEESAETVAPLGDTTKSTELKARKVSLHRGIPLLQNQVAKLRQTFEANNSQPGTADKKEPRRSSGGGPAPIKTRTWEKRIVSAPQYEVTVSANAAPEPPTKSRKPSWTSRIRKDTFDSRHWRSSGGSTNAVEPIEATPVENKPVTQPTLKLVVTDAQETAKALPEIGLDSRPVTASAPAHIDEEFAPSPVSAIGGGRFEEHLDEPIRNDSTMEHDEANVSPLVTPTSTTFSTEDRKIARKPVKTRNSLRARLSMIRRKSDRPELISEDTDSAPANVTVPDEDKELPSLLPQITAEENDISRFSWTTVNTTTTAQVDSPPPSPPAELEDAPPLVYEKTRGDNKKVVTPPTPPMDNGDAIMTQTFQPPAHLEPHIMTRYDSMMAKELELKARHHEIEDTMKRLLVVEKASPLEVDWRTRKENKKQLDASLVQLAEVERKQHELGLRIARFGSKELEGAGMEPSLWVRRVTS